MGLVERIKIVFDVDDGPGVKGLRSIRTEMANAEGATGKLKAGFSGAFDMVKQNAAPIALAAAGAFVAFAAKGVQAFQETALAAGKFSDATGIAVEDASRLIEVSNDLGISTGTIQSAMQRFSKTVADGKAPLKDWGVEIVRAKDGSVDAYESFINAATAIGRIKDPTERAKAAQQAFGKSYGEIAEMMEMSADQLRAKLASVSDEKVIDEGEVDKARKFRDAVNDLKDRVEDLSIKLGQALVPMLTDVAEAVGAVDDAAEKVVGEGGLGKLLSWAGKLSPLGQITDTINNLKDAFGTELQGNIADTAFQVDEVGAAGEETAGEIDHMDVVIRDFNMGTGADFKKAAEAAAEATRKWKDDVAALLGKLDAKDAFANFEESMWNYRAQVDPSDQSTRDYVRSLAEMIEGLAGVPPETKARLIAELDQGDIASVESYLQTWGKGINVPVRFQGQGSIGFEKNATGTDFFRGGRTLVGEEGPEFVDLPRGSKVYPRHETAQMQMASPGSSGTGGGDGGGITMHTTVQVMGNVYGVDDFDARIRAAIDARDQQLVQVLRAGRRQ